MTHGTEAKHVAHPLDGNLDQYVLCRLMEQHFRSVLRTAPILLAINAGLSLFFYLHYRGNDVLVWGLVASAIPFFRGGVAWAYHLRGTPMADGAKWERWVFYPSFPIFSVYAVGAFVLLRPGEDFYNAVLCLWFVALTSATVAQSPSPRIQLVAAALLAVPLVARVFLVSDHQYWVAAAILIAITQGHLLISMQSYRHHVESIRQSKLNEELASRLEVQARIALNANLEKTRFLAAASHDLRQPMLAVSLLSSALDQKFRGLPDSRDLSALAVSVASLGNALDSLLDLSRFDAGGMAVRTKHVKLHKVFADLQQNFIVTAQRSGLALRFRGGNATIATDPELFARLLGNLVDNAIKYTRKGGVLVASRFSKTRPGYVIIEVRDSGQGIASEYQSRIFDEFFRLPDQDVSKSNGRGLGLSIVKRLSQLLNIRVELESAPGCGSTFRLTCIAAPEEQEADPEPRQEIDTTVLSGRRILVLDDEPEILRAVAALLSPYGAFVDAALNEAEAVMHMQTQRSYDLVLADIQLGDEAGPRVVANLKRYSSHPLKVILMTAQSGNADHGPHLVLRKPMHGDQLLSAVVMQLSKVERS